MAHWNQTGKAGELVAVVDIGSGKIVAGLAQLDEASGYQIICIKEVPSNGVRKGAIVNIALLESVVNYALELLEEEQGIRIHRLIVSASGTSVMSYNIQGKIEVKAPRITKKHILQSIIQARDTHIPENRRILHTLPQGFVVDGQTGIEDPVGMLGEILISQLHVISVAESVCQNLESVFLNKNIEIDSVVATVYASSLATLTEDEKQLGVCLLDIGAGTTEIAIYRQGKLCHAEVIPIGGDLMSSDLAFYLKTTLEEAEHIKKQIDIARGYSASEQLAIQSINSNKQVNKADVVMVVQERLKQLLDMVMDKASRAGYEAAFPGGFVLCGGVANLPGVAAFVAEQTGLPVRLAILRINSGDTLKSPEYATVLGLFDWACSNQEMQIGHQQRGQFVDWLLACKKKIMQWF